MMTRDPEKLQGLYWLSNPEWYGWDEERGYYLKDRPDLPDKVRKSYEYWLKDQA